MRTPRLFRAAGLTALVVLCAPAQSQVVTHAVSAGTGQSAFEARWGSHAALSIRSNHRSRLIVGLSQHVFHIRIDPDTGAPLMPRNARAFVRLAAPAVGPAPVYTWRILLTWSTAGVSTASSLAQRTFQSASPFRLPFGSEIRGGTLTVYASTQHGGETCWGEARAKVVADNPDQDQVLKAYPASRLGLIASKIGEAESGLHQFTPAGLPLVSATFDVGLMQLNAPTGGLSSPDQVWDWRANVARGIRILEAKRSYTQLASRHAPPGFRSVRPDASSEYWLSMVRTMCGRAPAVADSVPTLSSEPGSGMLPGEPDPDHLDISQVEREEIRRYNGGDEYRLERVAVGSESSWQWVIDPTRGGIAPGRGDPHYVDHVLLARSGFRLIAGRNIAARRGSHA
ncbi:MAG: hypothetical protein KGJ62_08970 [Armatimonadetes bacterium]|nr:hypothetical protein [Armatimonadota bacterium]MDE2206450.1 hypothetical protein [Armatimonadota bacterium]